MANPLDQPARDTQLYKANVKPVWPPCDGRQFADNPTDPDEHYLDVNYDQFNGEHPEDKPMCTPATPRHTNPQYVGKQYSEDWKGGFTPYGVSVEDGGQSPSREQIGVDVTRADRGKE